jgi:hypothetical protein
MHKLSCGLDAIAKRYHNCPLTGKANSHCAKKSKRSVSISVDPFIGIGRAAGNGLGRGRPARERGQ